MKRFTLLFAVLAILCLVPSAFAQAPCEVPDDGSGTVTMPPDGCGYLTAKDYHLVIDTVDPNAIIIVEPIHGWFVCGHQRETGCVIGGSPTTGETEQFDSIVRLQMTGKGSLQGYSRTLDVAANVTTQVGPRFPYEPVQSFGTEMVDLSGSIVGDPDFAYLAIEAGSANGLPSPGQTTLSQQANGTWRVNSHFDVNYRINFQGAPGSLLEGREGSTEGVVQMSAAAGTNADGANP